MNSPPGGTCHFSVFLGSLRNRLAVNPCTARRHKPATHFLGFVMNCLVVMNTYQATRVELTRFLCSVCFGVILFGEK